MTHSSLCGTDKYFSLPDESPRLVRIYIDFLKTGHLDHPDSNETRHRRFSFGTLVDIFTFAKDLEIYSLRNAALDEFFLHIYDDPDRLPYKYIDDIYKVTSPGSALRSVIVDAVVNIGMKKDVQAWADKLPNAFTTDCLIAASEDGIVPFSSEWSDEDIFEWLDERKENMCEMFYHHEYEEQVVPQPRAFVYRTSGRMGKKARRGMQAEAENEPEMDQEREKMVEEESAERMRYLMEPLPHRQRY